METNRTRQAREARQAKRLEGWGKHAGVAELTVEALVGAAAGAATGMLGGPPGIIAGAIIGGAIGAVAGAVLHKDHVRLDAENAQLDRDIGVFGGSIGEAPPDAPESERGVFHAASMGVGGGGSPAPSEGPMQNLSDEE
jgi:hypothetical protein